MEQLDGLLLKGGLLFGFDLPAFPCFWIRAARAATRRRCSSAGPTFRPLCREVQFAQQLRMVDEENGAGVSHLGPEHDFQEPGGGLELFRVVPEFPRGDFFQRQITGGADLEQRVAADRIERLDAAIHQYRQPAELADVELAVFFGRKDSHDFGAKQRDEAPGNELKEEFHAGVGESGVMSET